MYKRKSRCWSKNFGRLAINHQICKLLCYMITCSTMPLKLKPTIHCNKSISNCSTGFLRCPQRNLLPKNWIHLLKWKFSPKNCNTPATCSTAFYTDTCNNWLWDLILIYKVMLKLNPIHETVIYMYILHYTCSRNCDSLHKTNLVAVPTTTGSAASRYTLSQVIHS